MINNLGRIIKDNTMKLYKKKKRGSHVQILVSKGVLGTNL